MGVGLLIMAIAPFIRSLAPAIATFLFGLAIAGGGAYLFDARSRYDRLVERAEELALAERYDKELSVLRALSELTPEQMEIVRAQYPTLLITPKSGVRNTIARTYYLEGALPHSHVPEYVIQRFLRESDELDVCPQRRFSEGRDRDYYLAALNWLTMRGLIAEQARGPHPARWKEGGYAQAIAMFAASEAGEREEK